MASEGAYSAAKAAFEEFLAAFPAPPTASAKKKARNRAKNKVARASRRRNR